MIASDHVEVNHLSLAFSGKSLKGSKQRIEMIRLEIRKWVLASGEQTGEGKGFHGDTEEAIFSHPLR